MNTLNLIKTTLKLKSSKYNIKKHPLKNDVNIIETDNVIIEVHRNYILFKPRYISPSPFATCLALQYILERLNYEIYSCKYNENELFINYHVEGRNVRFDIQTDKRNELIQAKYIINNVHGHCDVYCWNPCCVTYAIIAAYVIVASGIQTSHLAAGIIVEL